MSEYSEQELRQMQEEAIRRVREMQQRAQRTAQQQGWVGSTAPAEEEETAPLPSTPPPQSSGPAPSPLAELFRGQTSSPLAGLMQWAGGERGILLALLAVLMGEGADPTLLLALFYLAMFDDEPPSDPPSA